MYVSFIRHAGQTDYLALPRVLLALLPFPSCAERGVASATLVCEAYISVSRQFGELRYD